MLRRPLQIAGALLLALLLLALAQLAANQASNAPESFTRGNILPNADFAVPDANPSMPAGWSAGTGAARSQYTYTPGGYSMQLYGSNNALKSPSIDVRPGQIYRLAMRVLCESPGGSKVRVWFRWMDVEGDEVAIEKHEWWEVPGGGWALISEQASAPAGAARLAISIHPAADDRLFIDDLSLNVAGIYLEPWPDGAVAALSLSVDWETAMGGLIHTQSLDAASVEAAVARGLAMRQGSELLLGLLAPHGLAATWFANGYNFLTGNVERRSFMPDPRYTLDPGSSDPWREKWNSQPWFGADPYGTVETHPAWYFGDLVPRLLQAGQSIQSHTFSHFYGGFVAPELWRADLTAWNDLAAERGVGGASALAFPWSSSDGMTDAHWQELRQAGIVVATRTSDNPRYRIERLDLAIPRPHPAYDWLLVFPDAQLKPETLGQARALLDRAAASHGAIDLWAHTDEIVREEQVAAWRALIDYARGRGDIWIAPLTEIASRWRAVRQVEVNLTEQPGGLLIQVSNQSGRRLEGLRLRLPATPQRVEVDGAPSTRFDQDSLTLDLAPGQRLEVRVWPA